MMTQIKENLENEVALADKAEEKAIEDHVTLTTEIELLTGAKTKTEEERDATIAYLKKIEPNCEWIKGAFTLRAKARAKEEEGLMEAKSILAGAVFVQEDQKLGFLQKVQ